MKIVFLHIPKTAGSSIDAFLGGACKNPVRFDHGNVNDFNDFMSLDLGEVGLVTGHLQLQNLLRRDLSAFRFVTVLRDPIEREISTYRYILSWPKHPLHEQFKDCSFEQFIEKTADARNLQCRFFSGKPSAAAAIQAIENHFDFVGTVGDMPVFLSALSDMLGVETPGELPEVNKTRSDVTVYLSDGFREYLKHELSEDYLLFDFVRPFWMARSLVQAL